MFRPMTAALALHGVDALWPLCLAIAAQRRHGDVHPAIQGATWTTAHGFALTAAEWSDEAVELFDLLKPLLDRPAHGTPWVIGQLGQSLDGCIATHSGDSCFVNGPEVLTHLHRLRALCDAVIVGAGTAATDDPQLTTRHVAGDHPVRVVLDPALTLAPTLKVFSDRQAATLLVCDAKRRDEAAERVGADQVLGIPGFTGADGKCRMPLLIDALARHGLRVLFVEGGGTSVSRFITQGCMDRLHLSIAPVFIGDGRAGLQLPRSSSMRDCLRPRGRVYRLGADMLWDLDLRSQAPTQPAR